MQAMLTLLSLFATKKDDDDDDVLEPLLFLSFVCQ